MWRIMNGVKVVQCDETGRVGVLIGDNVTLCGGEGGGEGDGGGGESDVLIIRNIDGDYAANLPFEKCEELFSAGYLAGVWFNDVRRAEAGPLDLIYNAYDRIFTLRGGTLQNDLRWYSDGSFALDRPDYS